MVMVFMSMQRNRFPAGCGHEYAVERFRSDELDTVCLFFAWRHDFMQRLSFSLLIGLAYNYINTNTVYNDAEKCVFVKI